jgi:hypothetical protein
VNGGENVIEWEHDISADTVEPAEAGRCSSEIGLGLRLESCFGSGMKYLTLLAVIVWIRYMVTSQWF